MRLSASISKRAFSLNAYRPARTARLILTRTSALLSPVRLATAIVYYEGPTATTARFTSTRAEWVSGAGVECRGSAARLGRVRILVRTVREDTPALTPTLSLSEGEGVVSRPSPPEGERARVRGEDDANDAFVNDARCCPAAARTAQARFVV